MTGVHPLTAYLFTRLQYSRIISTRISSSESVCMFSIIKENFLEISSRYTGWTPPRSVPFAQQCIYNNHKILHITQRIALSLFDMECAWMSDSFLKVTMGHSIHHLILTFISLFNFLCRDTCIVIKRLAGKVSMELFCLPITDQFITAFPIKNNTSGIQKR